MPLLPPALPRLLAGSCVTIIMGVPATAMCGHPFTKEIKMLINTSLPEEVRTALLTYHIVQDDLLDVEMLLDQVDDLPDGARYLPLSPGSTDPGRSPDELSPNFSLSFF
jgi:hypothetical protein